MPEGLLGMFAVSERASRDDKVGLEQNRVYGGIEVARKGYFISP
jgi:hypothetical protein